MQPLISTMLQWKATHARTFKQHQLALTGQGKDKEHKVGWEGKEGESVKSWGRGNKCDSNMLYKILKGLMKIY